MIYDVERAGGQLPPEWRRTTRLQQPRFPVTVQSASEAYLSVLSDVEANARLECDGSWTASADPVDRRIIAEAFFGWGRLVSHEAEVGGHPKPAEGVPCQDIDSDGMPDQWELLHGLDPIIPSDSGQDPDGDGYTSIEEYVNGTDPRSSLSLSAAVPFMRH